MSLVFAPSSLRMVRGLSWNDALQLVDDNGDPVSLAGSPTITMRVRRSVASSVVLMELTTGGADPRISIAVAAEGKLTISVAAEDTLAFPVNGNRKAKYVYDAVIDRGGDPQVIEPAFRGKLTVLPQITRILPEP